MSTQRVARHVLFDDVPLDTGGSARFHDLRERQGPLPGRGVARLRARRPVLHVEQAHAIGGRADLGDRIAATERRPVDVQLDLDLGRKLGQQDVPDRRAVQRRELEVVVVVAEPDPVRRERPWRTRRARRRSDARRPRSDDPPPASTARSRVGTRARPVARRRPSASSRSRSMPSWEATTRSPAAFRSPASAVVAISGRPGELDGPVAGRGHRLERPGQVVGHQSADGVELERDLVMSHPRTIGHPTDVASAP